MTEPDFLPPEPGPVELPSRPFRSEAVADENVLAPENVSSWFIARIGLRVGAVACWVLAGGGFAVTITLWLLAESIGNYNSFARDVSEILSVLAGIGITGGLIAYIVSIGFFLVAPPVRGVRTLGRISFILLLLPLLLILVVVLIRGREVEAVAVLMQIVGVGGLILAALMVRQTAYLFRCPRSATVAPIVTVTLLAASVIITWVVMFANNDYYSYGYGGWRAREQRQLMMIAMVGACGAVAFVMQALASTAVARKMREALPTMRAFASVSDVATRRMPSMPVTTMSAPAAPAAPVRRTRGEVGGWEWLRVPAGLLRIALYRRRVDGGWMVAGWPDDDDADAVFHGDVNHEWDGTTLPGSLLGPLGSAPPPTGQTSAEPERPDEAST